MSFKLVLDRKEIEQMLLLGLETRGFELAEGNVTWKKGKGGPVSVTVNVTAIQRDKMREKRHTPRTGSVDPTVENENADQGTVIPDQEMDDAEIRRVLESAARGGR